MSEQDLDLFPPARIAYVGSYTRPAEGGSGNGTDGISVFAVDPDSGALTLSQVVPQVNPSWVTLDPEQRFLYASIETDDYEGEPSGGMAAYAVDPETGQLTYINEQSSGGNYPCHQSVDPSGRFLVAANYGALAVDLAVRGITGRMVALREGRYTHVAADMPQRGVKRVDVDEFYDTEGYKPKVAHVQGKPMFLY